MAEILLSNRQSAGDGIMLTAAVRELKQQYPDFKVWVDSSALQFFENNPLIENHKIIPQVYNTGTAEKECSHAKIPKLKVGYDDDDGNIDNPWSLHKVHDHRKHFIWGMVGYLNQKLGLDLTVKTHHADLYLTEEEKKPLPGLPEKYWVVNSGVGPFFPAKQWSIVKWADLFQMLPDVTFVQMGGKEKDHHHANFNYPNVINYVGKTTLRSSLSLLHNAQGLISSVTYAMHAWAAIHHETKRPFITIGGGREQWWWETYPQELGYNHQYLHTMGSFPCCTAHHACWKSVCENKEDTGYPKCLEKITPKMIADIVNQYT